MHSIGLQLAKGKVRLSRWLSGKEYSCQGRRHKRCGFDLADKDSKYLIVVVKLCMESSSRVSPRKIRLLLLTKSQACEAPPAADGHFLPGFWGRVGSWCHPRESIEAGKSSILRGTSIAFMEISGCAFHRFAAS